MYPEGLVLGVVLVWLVLLTVLVLQSKSFLKRLLPKGNGNLKDKLEEILSEIRSFENFRKESVRNFQKIGLKRFNPYQDTGGDQSFSLAVLDGKDDGVILTSLHSRSGTRVFAKNIKNGKADNTKLSEEENQVLKETLES